MTIVRKNWCILSALFLPLTALGHHSTSVAFDTSVVAELEGEVTDVRWRNPHVSFTLKTESANDQETSWNIESHSLSIMRRMDLAEPFIHVGDEIKVAGNPARRADAKGMFVQNILLASGEEWVFKFGASPADLRWSDRLLGTTDRWFATEGEASQAERGIFRVWSTALASGGGGLRLSSYPLTESAQAARAEFDPIRDDPLANCAPKGMPYIMTQPYPMEFVEEDDAVLLRVEEYDTVRRIHMGNTAPAEQQPRSLLGYSVGHWEGDTLVVRTSRVSYPYFDGRIPQSEAAAYVERITATADGSRLDYSVTITDPEVFTVPVVLQKSWVWLSDVSVEPYDCTVGG